MTTRPQFYRVVKSVATFYLFILKFYLFLFLDDPELCCCVAFSLVMESGGYSLAAVHGPLIAVASLVEHGL